MKLEQIIKLRQLIEVNYASFFKESTQQEFSIVIKSWDEILKDLDGQMVLTALKNWMFSSKYPPSIADLREGYDNIVQTKILAQKDNEEKEMCKKKAEEDIQDAKLETWYSRTSLKNKNRIDNMVQQKIRATNSYMPVWMVRLSAIEEFCNQCNSK